MSWGILEMLGSVTTLIAVVPLAFAGTALLLGGNLLVGLALLGVAVTMLGVDRYVTTPGDLPVLVATKLVDAIVRPPDEE
jgi:hypothetical protein